MTARLVGAARAHWVSFDGWAVEKLSGGDPLDLPMDRFSNFVYHWLTRHAAEDEIRKFDNRLWRPPAGERPAPGSPWSPERETSAFRGLAAEVKGSPVQVG